MIDICIFIIDNWLTGLFPKATIARGLIRIIHIPILPLTLFPSGRSNKSDASARKTCVRSMHVNEKDPLKMPAWNPDENDHHKQQGVSPKTASDSYKRTGKLTKGEFTENRCAGDAIKSDALCRFLGIKLASS